jgi:uncharacterized protein YdeI (YjbR/CyaY-like superfamily)
VTTFHDFFVSGQNALPGAVTFVCEHRWSGPVPSSPSKSGILPLSLSPRATVQIKIFNTAAEFREWLEENHSRASELWLGFYNKRTGKKSITYREALDEALCFGWIDGVRKSIDEASYKQRFTPRRPKSYWSAVNIRRADELASLGRMSAPGAKAFEQRISDSGKYSFESRPKKLPLAYQRQFKANGTAWEFSRPRLRGTSGPPPSGW